MGSNEFNKEALDAFATTYFSEKKLKEAKITAAAVAVVHKDQVIYKNALGLQNIKREIAATTEHTMFRIGSISKTFVGTAVLQVVEQGKLDLHQDINTYLPDFQIPKTFNQPITLHHLLTHTSGFEEVYLNTVSLHFKERISLSDYVKNYLPKRIQEPGKVIAYNNFGPTLAAYIVQTVTGIPYEVYVVEHILKPLGMIKTDLDIRDQWLEQLALEYVYKDEQYKEIAIYSEHTFPSGEMIATTDDMAKYMIAHLNEMRTEANVLFQKKQKPLYETQFSHHQKIPGYAYTFHEKFFGEKRFLEHGGSMAMTNSYMVLSPDHDFGLYFVYVGNQSPTQIVDDFFTTFLPTHEIALEIDPIDNSLPFQQIKGKYAPNVYPVNDFTRFSLMTSGELTVDTSNKGYLKISGFGEEKIYYPIGEAEFQSDEGDYISFESIIEGKDSLVYRGIVLDKLPWFHVSLNSNTVVLVVTILLFVSTVAMISIRTVIKIVRKTEDWFQFRDILYLFASLSYLFTVFSFSFYLATVDTMFYLNHRVPVLLKLGMSTPIIGLLCLVGLIIVFVRTWHINTLFRNIFLLFFLICSFIFHFILDYYHLMGSYY